MISVIVQSYVDLTCKSLAMWDHLAAGGTITRCDEDGPFVNLYNGFSTAADNAVRKFPYIHRGNKSFTIAELGVSKSVSTLIKPMNTNASTIINMDEAMLSAALADTAINVPLLQDVKTMASVKGVSYKLEMIKRGDLFSGYVVTVAFVIDATADTVIKDYAGVPIWNGTNQVNTYLTYDHSTKATIKSGGVSHGDVRLTDCQTTFDINVHPVVNGDLQAFTEGLIAGETLVRGLV